MQDSGEVLESLRAEIDRIDDAMLDGLLRRVEVVERIKAAKASAGGAPFRPGREALIMRRLVAKAGGAFPAPALVRLWREIIAAFTWRQCPFRVAVAGGEDLRTVARDHFGSLVPLMPVDSAVQAMRAFTDDQAQLAVLPLPAEGEAWWRWLMGPMLDERVQVIGRLPFAPRPGQPSALLLGRAAHERTGDDLALMAIETLPELSRARLRHLFEAAEMAPVWLAVLEANGEPPMHLIELKGFVEDCLAVVPSVLAPARGQVLRAQPVGGYARPLDPAA
ncbi:MAG: chorismate mutase [Geminicoccaceae bacterium]|nr:chorismate mutase [Geminicoccaceae bacterium]